MAAANYYNQVYTMFVGYFGRPPAQSGLDYYAGKVDAAGGKLDVVIDDFFNSAESKAYFSGKTVEQQVNQIFQNLFGRDALPAGLNYWTSMILSGKVALSQAAYTIANNAAAADVAVRDAKVASAKLWVAGLDTTAEVLAYGSAGGQAAGRDFLKGVTTSTPAAQSAVDAALLAMVGSGSANPGQTFTLTTAVDAIVGTNGNDTITGVVSATAGESTMGLADTIDGGAGTDTFKLIVSGAVAMAGAEIKNVENFEIKDLTGGNTHNFANVTGEQQVLVVASTGNTTVTNLDKAAVGVKDITGAAATQTFTFKDSAFAATSNLDVVVNNAGNVVTGNAQTITIGTASAGTGAAGGVNIAATGVNNIILSGTAGNNIGSAAGIKALTVTGTGVVALGATSSLSGAADGALLTNLATVDASANSGGLIMGVGKSTVKVTGGSGNDKITVAGAMTKGAEFKLGAGNDQLLLGAGGSLDANVVVDAGDGIDVIDNGLITVANGAIFKNFEKIALSTAVTTDVELLTGSTIQGLLINGNAAATVQNVATGSTIDVTSTTGASNVTVGVKGAAASATDTLVVNFDGAAAAATPAAATVKAGTLVANKVEGLTIHSGGAANTWNSIAVTDDGLQTITIDGAKNLDLTFTGTNGTNNGALGGAVKSIDASAATGKLNINLANVTFDNKVGFTLKGGTGSDTITTNASTATLTGGGGNDKFVVTATVTGTADATTAAMVKITDFNAGDMISAAAIGTLTKTQTDIGTATNLTQAIDLALKNASVIVGNAAWFQYGGDTYVAIEVDATDGFSAGDTVVKLTGLVDLTSATVAGNTITLV